MKDLFQYIVEKGDKYFGNVAFGEPDNVGYPQFLKLQGKSVKDKEKNTDYEKKLLYALEKWVATSSAGAEASSRLTKLLPVIKRGKELFPSIFKPSQKDGTPVYRGLAEISPKLMKLLATKTKQADWTAIKGDYMMCTKPIKYTPRSNWQSWSYSFKVADSFGTGGIMVTKQDANFYFNPKVLKIVFDMEDEQEIIHYGNNYSSKIFIALEKYEYEDLVEEWSSMKSNKKDFATMGKQLLKKHK